MSKYLLFAGQQYPRGGAYELVGAYETVGEAKSALPGDPQWAHVIEIRSLRMVAQWEHLTGPSGHWMAMA